MFHSSLKETGMVVDSVNRHCSFSTAKFCPTLLPPPWTLPTGLHHKWDFSGKNPGVGCHFPCQGNLDPGIKPTSLALAGGFPTTEPPGRKRNLVGSWSFYSLALSVLQTFSTALWICNFCPHPAIQLFFVLFAPTGSACIRHVLR